MMSPMCNNNMLPGSGPGPMNSGLPGPMGSNQVGMMHGAMPPMKCQSQPSSMDMMADSPNPNPMLSNSVLPPPIGNYPEDQFPLSPQASLAGNLMHPSESCGQFLYTRPEAVAHRSQPAQQAHTHLATSKSKSFCWYVVDLKRSLAVLAGAMSDLVHPVCWHHFRFVAGVKIPDENLTPTQRLRREDKLAALRKIGEMLERGNHHQSSPHHPINSELPPSTHNPPISVDEISSVLSGDNNGSGGEPTDVPLQKTTNAPGGPPTTPGDWQNMPSFFDERGGKRVSDVGNMNRCGSRSQGPPPPYHQTTRSASVPIAIPSPNPNSPGNATSNLSLPSPRTCSGLNSPASKQGPGPSPTTNQMNTSIDSPGQSHGRGLNISNPGTPVSSSMHLSPNSKQKEGKMCTGPMSNEFSPAASGQQSPGNWFFGWNPWGILCSRERRVSCSEKWCLPKLNNNRLKVDKMLSYDLVTFVMEWHFGDHCRSSWDDTPDLLVIQAASCCLDLNRGGFLLPRSWMRIKIKEAKEKEIDSCYLSHRKLSRSYISISLTYQAGRYLPLCFFVTVCLPGLGYGIS